MSEVFNQDSQLLIHLTYQEKVFYISDSAITSSYTYWPFLASSPSISYGGEGYVKVNSGSLSILKDYDNNEYHPFSGTRYLDVLTSVQEIPFEMYIGNSYLPLFSGTLALEGVTQNTLEFTIMEEEFEEPVLYPVLNESLSIIDDVLFIKPADGILYPLLRMYDNPFNDGDEIIFEAKENHLGISPNALNYERLRNNRYVVTDRTTSFFRILDEENPENLITASDLGILESHLVADQISTITDNTTKSLYDNIESAFSLGNDRIWRFSSAKSYYAGSPSPMPFSFGQLEIRNPVIRYGDREVTAAEKSTHSLSFDSVYLIRNPQLDHTDSSLRIFDGGVEVTSNLVLPLSNTEFIALQNYPVDEVAISGQSLNGQSIGEFFEKCCQYLNGFHLNKTDEIDLENLDSIPDFTMAPHHQTMILPIFQESEITMLELASSVAEATNHFFYFEPYLDANGDYRRQMKLIDINEVLFNEEDFLVEKEIREDDQLQIDLRYPFPIKAIESSITVNRLYQGIAEEERNRSEMRPTELNFRVDIHSIGNNENREVYAQNVSDGKQWLRRFKATMVLPTMNVELKHIQSDLTLGKKVRVFDEVRGIMGDLLIQELSFDFAERRTTIQGLSLIQELERY